MMDVWENENIQIDTKLGNLDSQLKRVESS